MKRRKMWTISFGLGVIAVLVFLIFRFERARAPQIDTAKVKPDAVSETPADTLPESPDLEDPALPTIVVNKKRPLPSNYAPSDLRSPRIGGGQLRAVAVDELNALVGAARADGVSLKLISGYRSYANQQSVYNGYVSRDGQAEADTYSARPGYSEHQTGWAADLGSPDGTCELETCFGGTPAGKWLASHAHEYGFIIRYPNGKESITGYQYEPWHLRYIGRDLAAKIYASGQTLEEYYKLPAAPTY